MYGHVNCISFESVIIYAACSAVLAIEKVVVACFLSLVKTKSCRIVIAKLELFIWGIFSFISASDFNNLLAISLGYLACISASFILDNLTAKVKKLEFSCSVISISKNSNSLLV